MSSKPPRLDLPADQLSSYVATLAQYGRNARGGIDRPVYSPAWAEARRQVATWMEELGLAVRSDAVGNLFGRLEGDEPAVVLTGSHLDTVPNGGPLDGALGIHAALTAVGALARTLGRPRRTLEVVAICEEEGAAFPCGFWGARAMIGAIAPGEADAIAADDGRTIGRAMREQGFDPARIPEAHRTDLTAFLELHIEQGRIMADAGVPVGVVSTITGQDRGRVVVRGRPDHAGTTPMDLRRDAYLGAAEMALGIAALAERIGRPAVATVGHVRLEPGAINVVPGQVTFTFDARHPDPARQVELLDGIRAICRDVAERRGLGHDWLPATHHPPQPLEPALRDLLARCAEDLAVPRMPMISGAGHDSQVIARAVPTAMLFVPSLEGRSHRPDEWTPVDQILPGVRVLAEALRRLAYEEVGMKN
jgi:allantoate deiminase